ncbi:hypothetical protein BDR07DRAFT_1445676 [Suillus spraguei]|nr:hypothetical protein BDR07DRAFT_1445676 [Suillus spraguei]
MLAFGISILCYVSSQSNIVIYSSDWRHVVGLPSVSVTDVVRILHYFYHAIPTHCTILGLAQWWIVYVVNVMLGYILIIRLHAMYQRSRKISNFLSGISMAVTIICAVILAVASSKASGEELILSGAHLCVLSGKSDDPLSETWILTVVWEVLVLCLAVWIAIRHFSGLQRRSAGRDCFIVHAAVSCLSTGSSSTGTEIYSGILEISLLMQMFVLGPRLLLSVREYHAKLVADSETGTNITTIAFQEGIPVSTSDSV